MSWNEQPYFYYSDPKPIEKLKIESGESKDLFTTKEILEALSNNGNKGFTKTMREIIEQEDWYREHGNDPGMWEHQDIGGKPHDD